MRKFLLFLISFLIGIGLFVWIVEFVGWEEIKNAFLVFTGWQGIVILLLSALIILFGVWKWREILGGYDVHTSFFNLLKFYLAGFSLLFFFPIMFLGGEIFRGYLLKKKNFASWSKGMASVVIDRILDWTTNLISIFFGIIFFILVVALPPKRWILILGGVFLFWIIGISFFYLKVLKRESIVRFFLKISNFRYQNSQPLEVEKEIFNFFNLKKKSFWKGTILAFFKEGVTFLRAWLLISFLGKNLGFLPSLSILGFSYLAGMIPIPTAFGIHEAIQVFVFKSLGLRTGTATAYTMIIRGAELILALLGIFIFLRFGFKLLENSFSQRNKREK